ncbi:MAG: zinc-ribbon domain-containing protein [Anaerolineales bacterium]
MAKKTLGYEELQWTCPNCGGINPGPQNTCESCGAPQPDDVKFEQAPRGELLEDQEAIQRAQAGPDIHCPYCGARNPGSAQTCVQCGGDLVEGQKRASGEVLGAFKSGPAQIITCPHCGAQNPDTARTCSGCGGSLKIEKEEPPKPAAPAKSQGKPRASAVVIAIVALVCLLGAALLWFIFFRSQDVRATVTGVGWERQVEVQGLVPVEYSDWLDQIPAEGDILSCQQDVRSVEDQPQPNSEEVCGTPYSVDTGSGYAEVVQDCEYHVYDDYCTYTLIEWALVDTVSLTGNDFNPIWPDPSLGADQQLGAQSETYSVYFDDGGNNYTYDTSDMQEWQQYEIGSHWNLEVNTIGGVLSVEP